MGKTQIKRQQTKWAEGIKKDQKYEMYTSDIEDNLYNKNLTKEAKCEFENADGSELKDGQYPAKIKALYSSSALAYNVFEYWRKTDKTILSKILESKSPIVKLQLEKKLNTGISTPNIDVFLTLSNDKSISVESKFCEWMDSKINKKFKPKYFFHNGKRINRWEEVGLENCQSLARKIQTGDLSFKRFDATQLLKHALGIGFTDEVNSQLIYLYYDLENKNSRIGNEHREEINIFSNQVDGELNFRTMTYQDVFRSFFAYEQDLESDYFNYLKARYFSQIK